jgi:sodium/potassium-transporting ATPase subunit alpha
VDTGLAELDHHLLSVDNLQRRFSTSAKGLQNEQIAHLISKYGKDQPSPPPSRIFQAIIGCVIEGLGSILL